MALTQVSSEGIKDAQVKTVDILDANITTAKIAADAVTGAKIADDAIDSEHYVDGSIDTAHIADDAVTTAKLANSINTDIAAKMPLAGGTITGDVVFDNATNAGNDITWDMSDNLLEFADDTGVSFGDGKDLQIFHDASNSWIKDVGTGNLYISVDTGSLNLVKGAAGEYLVRGIADGAAELYYDGTKKLYTASNGVVVSGESWASTKFRGNDDVKLSLGNGEDLQIYHNGSHSYIDHTGTGDLWIRSTPSGGDIYSVTADNGCFVIQNASGEGQFLSCSNGSTDLYYDNSKKFETYSGGCKVYSDLSVRGVEGGDAVLSLVSDEGDDNADNWRFVASADHSLYLQNWAGGAWENNIVNTGNGAVELYYNNSKKLETEPKGIIVNGGGSGEGLVQIIGANSSSSTIEFGDTDDDDVAQIWYDHYGKSLNLRTSEDAEINLYHNGSKKFETTSAGITVTGSANSATELRIENTNNSQNAAIAKLSLHGGDAANQGPIIELDRNGAYHQIEEDASGNLTFNDNGTIKYVMEADGDLQITDGNLWVAAGHGIDFSHTSGPTNGSGTSELFADYETGTWSPAAAVGPTAYGSGNYTKIGKMVYASFEVTFGSTSTASHQSITGLPYACASSQHGGVADGYTNNSNNPIIYHVSASDTKIYFYYGSGSNLNANNVTGDNFRGVAVYEATS